MPTNIDVAEDFSPVPAGRYITDGPCSGEAFRDKTLKPALDDGGEVIVEMDGGEGYGSSFLEETFGGLVRLGYFTKGDLRDRLEIHSDDESLIAEVWDYIEGASEPALN